MRTMAIRYLVHDVHESITFYTEHLGFQVESQFGPAMAILTRDGQHLWLAGPMSSAAQPLPSGQKPAPGGWNRMVLTVKDLSGLVSRLREKNVRFRNDLFRGPGGSQILCEDPSGNPIELFQPVN